MKYRRGTKWRSNTTVNIDREALDRVLKRNYLTYASASEMMGRCRGYLSVAKSKGHMSIYAIDDLAVVVNTHYEELLAEIRADDWAEY